MTDINEYRNNKNKNKKIKQMTNKEIIEWQFNLLNNIAKDQAEWEEE